MSETATCQRHNRPMQQCTDGGLECSSTVNIGQKKESEPFIERRSGDDRRGVTQAEFLQEFEDIGNSALGTVRRKNRDYAGDRDAFHNFRAIELLTDGKITTEAGMIVRLTDKYLRAINLILSDRAPDVVDESIADTLKDMANYANIMAIYRKMKHRYDRREP
jgi:hypothetical protein